MKYVKWIFVVLLISSLTSFVGIDKPTSGLNVGDKAPDFSIDANPGAQCLTLGSLQGNYVLLSFWASYDATSRMKNASLTRAIYRLSDDVKDVKLVSVSFDEYKSVFEETARKDGIRISDSYVDTDGEASDIFNSYALNRGFSNFLLNEDGVIIAKNIQVSELSSYLN